jgi:hypothetical protein
MKRRNTDEPGRSPSQYELTKARLPALAQPRATYPPPAGRADQLHRPTRSAQSETDVEGTTQKKNNVLAPWTRRSDGHAVSVTTRHFQCLLQGEGYTTNPAPRNFDNENIRYALMHGDIRV